MATKDENLHLELKHLQSFYHLLEEEIECKQTFTHLANSGYLQVSTLFENAIANCNPCLKVTSCDGYDFPDGSDGKLVTVRTSSHGKNYSAPVTNIHSKIGLLRVQVYERKQDKFYYFVIPHVVYRDIPTSSNIEIPFYMDGTPRRQNRCSTNWWKYEVSTFTEMACAQDKNILIQNENANKQWDTFFSFNEVA